jgi:biopolymer transport protein ExbB
VLPRAFAERFLGRLREGKLDRMKANDLCDLNPSPAARLAAAALARSAHAAAEMDRGTTLARNAERARLGRGLSTLRRVALLAPLLGLLGALGAAQRLLATSSGLPGAFPAASTWASVLEPLTAGVVLAVLALVAYDGLTVRLENLLALLAGFEAELADALAEHAVSVSSLRPGPVRPQPTGPHWHTSIQRADAEARRELG